MADDPFGARSCPWKSKPVEISIPPVRTKGPTASVKTKLPELSVTVLTSPGSSTPFSLASPKTVAPRMYPSTATPVVITGPSALPLMVMETTWSSVRELSLSSVAVMVNDSTNSSPSKRKSNASLPESNDQLIVPAVPVASITGPASTENISRNCVSVIPPVPPDPAVATDATDTVTTSVRSTSATDRLPAALNPLSVSVRSALLVSPDPTEISGASFVPMSVIVTSWLAVPPLPSSTVIVKTCVMVWPAAKSSSAPSDTSNVQSIWPTPSPVEASPIAAVSVPRTAVAANVALSMADDAVTFTV